MDVVVHYYAKLSLTENTTTTTTAAVFGEPGIGRVPECVTSLIFTTNL